MNRPEFTSELALQYLRNITAKLTVVFDRLQDIETKVEMLGTACKTAFDQTKVVVTSLAKIQEDTRMDLAEYGGTIEQSTFFS